MGRIDLLVGTPRTFVGSECSACGFDAVLRFPIFTLTPDGLFDSGGISDCMRCRSEAQE